MDESYNLAATKHEASSFEIEASAALRGGLIFSHRRVVPGSNTKKPVFLFSPSPSIHKWDIFKKGEKYDLRKVALT